MKPLTTGMTNPRTLLRAWNIRARKQLGQNFLADAATAAMIVARARLNAGDVVVEIGAGLGALTIPLAGQVRRVVAVEKDLRLAGLLRTELLAANIDNVDILPEDFLRMDLTALARETAGPVVVCGNLPYNVSSQILVKLIESRHAVSRAVLMFQKELAERLLAAPGGKSYGRITAMLRYCAETRALATVKASGFHPRPKVDSQVLEVRFRPLSDDTAHDEQLLFRVVKAAFANRRKTLKNALTAGGLEISAETASQVLGRAGIDARRRAETLSPAEFVALTASLQAVLDENLA